MIPEDYTPSFKTESCFTSDGVQWAIDSTSYKMMRECWYKYHLAIRLGIRATGEAPPLRFGQLLHLGRETYYKARHRGLDHRLALHETLRQVLAECWDGETSLWWSLDRKRNSITLLRTLVKRLDEVQDDAQFTLVLDGKPAIELPFKFELDRYAASDRPYALVGIMDRLVQHGSRIWPEDYKHTTSAYSGGDQSAVQERFAMDPQMTIYTLAGQVIFHQPVSGVLVDYHSIQIGDTHCVRAPVERNDGYIEEWLDETLDETLDELELNVQRDRWPHRDTSCFLCSFKSICPKAPSRRWDALQTGYIIHPWNPLTVREA